MEKIKFTQMFREAKRELTPEEKLDIIKNANPDRADEIQDEFDGASAMDGLDDFFEDYKDILDKEPVDDSSNDESTDSVDDEPNETDEKELNVNSTNKNADDEVEETDEEASKSIDTTIQNASIGKQGKSKLVINHTYDEKVLKTLKAEGMKSDFDKYEEYFGYTNGGTKSSVKVMFHTPEDWPIKTGDTIKNTHPMFHTVCCMNEFLIWRMGVQIYNNNPKIKKIFSTVINPTKEDGSRIAGSERNTYVKEHASDTTKYLKEAKDEILNGFTEIDDPFENSLENIKQKNNVIIFMFTKIFPTILKAAQTGKVNGQGSCTAKIFGQDNLYKKLYQIGRGDTDDLSKDDIIEDLILDSYNAFLGGRIGVRAPYENEINGKALIGNANAKPLCVFDDNWLEHEGAFAKNVFLKMDAAFSEKNPEFKIRNTRKTSGKGASKAIGSTSKGYGLIASGATMDDLNKEYELGKITKDELNDALKVMQNITTQEIEIEPFTVIATTVASDFRNFLSCMTRVGARKSNVFNVYGKKYWSKEEIENEKDPAKKEQMLEDNKLWNDAKMSILNFNPMSLNATISGKDGDIGTLEDTLAAPSEEVQRDLKNDLPKEFDNIKRILDNLHNQIKSKIDSDNKDPNDIGTRFFSLLKMEQMLYASFKWLGYSPRQAFNFAFGYMKRMVGGVEKVDKAIIKPGLWNRLAVKTSDGTTSNPDFGIGNTETRDLKNNTLIDSLYMLHNSTGLWFLDKTTEGMKAKENFLKLLESYYSTTIGEFKDFVRPLQGKQNSSDVSLEDYISNLGIATTLWRPGESYMPNEINQAAFGVSMQKVMMKNQEDQAKVSKWVRTILASNVNAYTFDPVLNPESPTFEKNKGMVDTIREITGINMYDYWDGQKVKKNELLNAFKDWEKKTGDVFQIFGNDTNYASLNDKEDNETYSRSSNILLGTEKTSNKNGAFTRRRMVIPSDPELIKRGHGITIPEAVEKFFNEIFRETTEKESSKK